jgi:hypothetical protein
LSGKVGYRQAGKEMAAGATARDREPHRSLNSRDNDMRMPIRASDTKVDEPP